MVWAATAPAFFSVLVSIVALFYFASMLYYNVVLKHHQGSWKTYFKAIYKAITKKK
jgi:hypothetical protein